MLHSVLKGIEDLKAMVADKSSLMAKNDALQAELTALRNSQPVAESKLAELAEKLTAAEANATSLLSAKTALEAKLTEATAAKEAAEAKAADLLTNPSKVALELAAKAGVRPDSRPKASVPEQKVLTRQEFEALAHDARNSFIRSGGKVS